MLASSLPRRRRISFSQAKYVHGHVGTWGTMIGFAGSKYLGTLLPRAPRILSDLPSGGSAKKRTDYERGASVFRYLGTTSAGSEHMAPEQSNICGLSVRVLPKRTYIEIWCAYLHAIEIKLYGLGTHFQAEESVYKPRISGPQSFCSSASVLRFVLALSIQGAATFFPVYLCIE